MEAKDVSPRLSLWVQKLQNLTLSPLSRDYPESLPEDKAKRSIEAIESLVPPSNFEDFSKKASHAASIHELLLSSYVILIGRLTGDEDVAIATNLGPDGLPFVLRVPI